MKATWLVMALCVLVTSLAGTGDSLARLRWGALSPVLLQEGQWWRLYQSALLQADWWALALNLNSLFFLGSWLAARYQAAGLLALFSLSILAGSGAALEYPVGPSLGAGPTVFALLTAALLCEKDRRAVVAALIVLNLAAAWKLHWNPASLAAGALLGLLWEAGLRRLPRAVMLVLAMPMLIGWVWGLTWSLTYRDLSSYPTRIFRDAQGRFELRHSALLQPKPASPDGRVFVFEGLGFEVGLAFLTEPHQASVREFGASHSGSVPQEMKVIKESEEVTPERVWLRLDLAPRRPGQPGASQGVMLITGQGRQRIHLGLLLGARRRVEDLVPLLTQIQGSLKLSVPPAQVRAQRFYEDAALERNRGEREQAVASLTKALKEQPDLVDALIARGFLLAQLGRTGEALADFEAAGRLAPQDPRSWLNRALLRVNENKFAEARPDLDRALELAGPNDGGTRFEAYNARGWCKVHQGDPAGALTDADAALALNPPPDLKALALDTRGFALEGLKRYPEALTDYAQAQKEKVPDAFLHAGELQLKLGRRAEGRAALEEFLKLAPQRPEVARVKQALR